MEQIIFNQILTLTLTFIFICLNVIDLIQTNQLLNISINAESNIIIRWIYKRFEIVGVGVFKLLTTSFILVVSFTIHPFGLAILFIMIILYSFIVYYNYKCLN